MKIYVTIPLLLASLYSLCGCASIISGTQQEVSFYSTPDGAEVQVSGKTLGKTPLTTTLPKKAGQSLVFSKPGYKPLRMSLTTQMDSWFWGNILIGGVVGSTTDSLSGAVDLYSPSQYIVTLNPENTTVLEEKASLSDLQKAKEYIVTNDKEVRADFHAGYGSYVVSLLELLKIKPEEKEEAIKKIQTLAALDLSSAEFAQQVTDLYKDRLMPVPAAPPPVTMEPIDKVPPAKPVEKRKPNGPVDEFFQELPNGERVVLKMKEGPEMKGVYGGYVQEGLSISLKVRKFIFLFDKTVDLSKVAVADRL
jgi:hypothetical protein